MALKILMLRKQLTDEEKRNAQLRADLEAFNVRERELERSIEEASTEEERSTVQSAVDTFEQERQRATDAVSASDNRIRELRRQVEEAEAAQAAASAAGGEERSGAGASGAGTAAMELRAAQEFQRTGRYCFRDVRGLLRASVKSNSAGVIGPTGVGGINGGGGVSSLVDMLKLTDCTGMASYKVAYLASDAADASAITEGDAPTESEPTFGSVEFTPTNYGTIGYVSKEIRKQSPLNYAEKVQESAMRSLRRKLNNVAVTAILASDLNDTLALTAASSAANGAALFDGSLLSKIILGYGGDEDVGGAGCLFLAKADLQAFAAVRGKNEYLPVYSIIPDTNNPSVGVIKDNNGLSCRYCLSKDVTALSTATLTTSAAKTMFYGVPTNAELAMWGGFDVEVNDGYKFAEGLLTVRGEVTGDVEVSVKKGFIVVTAAKAS